MKVWRCLVSDSRASPPPALPRVDPAVTGCPGRRFKRSLRSRSSQSAGLQPFRTDEVFLPPKANAGSALGPEGLAADVFSPQTSPSSTSCLSFCSISSGGAAAKRKRPCAAATIAANEPLFWLDVLERSLVKHISSTAVSRPAVSTAFYWLSPSTLLREKPPLLDVLQREAFLPAHFWRGDSLSGRRVDVAARVCFRATAE